MGDKISEFASPNDPIVAFRQKSVDHLAHIGKNDFWETPAQLLWDKMDEFNFHPKLDVCSNKSVAKRLKFKKFYSRRDSPLKKDWKQDFFMNPPYSQIGSWMAHAYEQFQQQAVEGMVLTYSKTDTAWWHMFVENNHNIEVHFQQGRIRFLKNGKIPTWCKVCKINYSGKKICTICKSRTVQNVAPYPSVWLIFRTINLQ